MMDDFAQKVVRFVPEQNYKFKDQLSTGYIITKCSFPTSYLEYIRIDQSITLIGMLFLFSRKNNLRNRNIIFYEVT